jgi:hypothetical protein
MQKDFQKIWRGFQDKIPRDINLQISQRYKSLDNLLYLLPQVKSNKYKRSVNNYNVLSIDGIDTLVKVIKVCEKTRLGIFKEFGILNFVYTSFKMQPFSFILRKRNKFVGTSVVSRSQPYVPIEFPGSCKNKLIYISMGTIYNTDDNFYNICIEAFGNTEYDIIMSVGKKTDISGLGRWSKTRCRWNYGNNKKMNNQ